MKINCIIDTCSCIYLSNIEYRQRPLLKYLNDCAILNYSLEVFKELNDHRDKNLPNFIVDKKRKLIPIKNSVDEYERRMLGKVLPSRKKHGNKGEIDNFLLSIDQIHHVKKNSVILITDDEKALNGIWSEWVDSFPLIKIWTSLDVVLYLYAEKIIHSKEFANDLIKGINSYSAPTIDLRSEETTKKLISKFARYNKRIEKISLLLN